MKSKVLIWSVVSILILGLVAGGYWFFMKPQTIVLADGTKLTLLAVTYGKQHKLAKSKMNGRKFQGGNISTTNDSICLWIEQKHTQNNWPNYGMLVYDGANTGCSSESMRSYASFNGNRQGDEVMGFVFQAFPRHAGRLYFHVQGWNMHNGQQEVNNNYFSIRNPASRSGYAKWAPENLPNNQQDGDLQVTLNRFEIGSNLFNNNRRQSAKPNDPMSQGVLVALRAEQGGTLVTNWQPVQIDTTDATGNHTRNRSSSNHQENDEEVMSYQYGLWPDEPAWKLRVEMSRNSGFNSDETWTASGLPVKPGDMNDTYQPNKRGAPAAETKLGENTVKVYPVIQMSSEQAKMYGGNIEGLVLIRVEPSMEGMRMTMIKITDDQGREMPFQNWGWGGQEYRYALKKMDDVKSVNVTLALHRSRYFEFMVQPKKK